MTLSNIDARVGGGARMAESQLQVRDVRLSFGGLNVLDGVDLDLHAGEILALVGPNGAGKTSVLNIIGGIYKPNRGSVVFEGRDVTRMDSWRVARLGIARTFQMLELFRGMSVLENLLVACGWQMRSNILACGIYWGLGQREEMEFRRKAEEVISFFELERFRKHPVGSLPFGVQRLVGVARALAMRPKVLLLDEPSSGLNRQEKEDLARFLLRIKYELGVSMLWVEHDMKLVSDMADRIAVLHYGRKIAEGTSDEVYRDQEVIRAYLGTAT